MLLEIAIIFIYMLLVIGVSFAVVLLCNYGKLSEELDVSAEFDKSVREKEFRVGDLVKVKEFNNEIAVIVDYDNDTHNYLVLFTGSYHNLKQWEPEEQLTMHIMCGEIIGG